MKYKNKTTGFSSIEVVIYMSLISLFSFILIITLQLNNRLNRYIYSQSLLERKAGRTSEIIENSIQKSAKIKFFNEEIIKNGFAIIDYNSYISHSISHSVYKNTSEKGNTLILQIPKIDNNKIEVGILIFQFIQNSLYIYEGVWFNKEISINNSIDFIFNIEGYFKKQDNGIYINFFIKDTKNKQKLEFVGYENITR